MIFNFTVQNIAYELEKEDVSYKGCSEKEILKLEDHFKVKLPSTYIDFLKIMGKRAGKYMLGSSVFYDEIFQLREYAIELLEEDLMLPLPENSFVFWMHQGYQFIFFKLDEGDNPPIYYYCEGMGMNDFEKKEMSFTGFLHSQLYDSGIIDDIE